MRAEEVVFKQTERAFLRSLVGDAKKPGLAPLLGWKGWHDRAVNAPRVCPNCHEPLTFGGNAPGWPDLILLRGATMVVAELKSERGKVTEHQRHWLEAFAKIRRVVVKVWRPSSFGDIERILRDEGREGDR